MAATNTPVKIRNTAGFTVDPSLPEQPTSPYPVDSKMQDNPKATNWVTDRAWICGAAGALAVVILAIWYNRAGIMHKHVTLFGNQITDTRHETMLFALVVTTVVMVLCEMLRLYLRSPKTFFMLDPDLKNNLPRFAINSLFNYLLWLGVLWLAWSFYRSANEYGYFRNAGYYQVFFLFIETALDVWASLWGVAYVFITRALKYDPESDPRELATTLQKALRWAPSQLPLMKDLRPNFDYVDIKNLRGLGVKIFFTPLMTVFFVDQFPHLVNNIGYVLDTLPNMIANDRYNHQQFNKDAFNLSMPLIFSVDVALAWCGYVISSRWVDNHTHSAEPTMLGMIVCIACYPPFQFLLGAFASPPGDRDVLQIPSEWIASLFIMMMVASYIVYMCSTLWFGVRFSNLTNRGIIRKGPFAFVRHPAYASKNFAWWCVMFPFALWNSTHNLGLAAFQIMGLILMTAVYYMRAITEERHLMADPAYQEYCRQVKYRFIPGIL